MRSSTTCLHTEHLPTTHGGGPKEDIMAIAPNSRSEPERLAKDDAGAQGQAPEAAGPTMSPAGLNFGAGDDDATGFAARRAGGEQQETTVAATAEPATAEPYTAEPGEADPVWASLMGRADDYGQGLPEAANEPVAQVADDGDVPDV
jgi:hypothetical protein